MQRNQPPGTPPKKTQVQKVQSLLQNFKPNEVYPNKLRKSLSLPSDINTLKTSGVFSAPRQAQMSICVQTGDDAENKSTSPTRHPLTRK